MQSLAYRLLQDEPAEALWASALGMIALVREESERRDARNESLFREVNEGIEKGIWPGDRQTASFRCECSRLDCSSPVTVALAEYERVRRNPRRFIVADGHESPETETVVERHAGYLVVEKLGAAGAEAQSADPRG